MQRPFFRMANLTWYVELETGRQVPLGRDPRFKSRPKERPKEPPPEIQRKYLAVMQRKGEPEDRTLSFCIDEYVASLSNCTRGTRYRASHFLGIFLKSTGDVKVSRLRAHHVDDALKGRKWKSNTVHAFQTRIDACLNYCARKDWIPANPLRGKIEKPTLQRRAEVMSAEDRETLIAGAQEPFKSALVFLANTGCRPAELRKARVEKCDLEKGVVMVPNKTRKKTGAEERPIFLSTAMIELCRGLIGTRTEGWLFRNSKGTGWTQTAFEHRMQRLCRDLGLTHGAALYSFRHGWGSAAINDKRMNPAMVAIQMGHTNLQQLMKTYLHSDHEAMRKALDE